MGRDDVLARLDAHLAEVAAGDYRFVLVGGEPGIGKSRLAAALAEIAQARGFGTAWGGCRETEGAPPYWPWTQVFRVLVDAPADHDGTLAPLLDARPVAETDRFRLFDAAVRALAAAARTQPFLVVLDDLHRADEASLKLLRFAVLTLREVPVLVVGTYRDTDINRTHPLLGLVGELAADTGFDLIGLGRLTRADTALLLRERAGMTDDATVDALHVRSGGNPFFLTELVKLGATGASTVPATVEAAIDTRLARLPETTRMLLGFAAALGRDIDGDLLADATRLSRRDVLAELEPAVRQGLIGAHPQAPGEYRFVHILVQETLYADLPTEQRLDLHDRLATALGRLVDSDPGYADAAAHHAQQAVAARGGRDRAFAAACRAARLAADRLADETAARWYRDALALAPPDPALHVTLELALGRVAGRAGHTDTARSALDRAWSAAARTGDRAGAADAALGLGDVVVSVGTVDAGLVGLLEAALDRLRPGDAALRARLSARLAMELYWGPLDRARSLAARAVTDARGLNEPHTIAAALAAQHFVLRGPDGLAERIRLGEELLTLARGLGDELLELHTRRILFADRLLVDLAAANAELAALEDLARRTRRPIATWYALVLRALRATMSGRLDEAAGLIDRAEALGERIGAQPAAMYATVQRCVLSRHLGRPGEHEQALRRVIDRVPALTALRALLALLLAECDRRAEASALLDELVAERCAALPLNVLWLAGVGLLAETAAALDHVEHATVLHDLLESHRGQVYELGIGGWCGAIEHVLARTATTLGRFDEADSAFVSALRVHEAWGALPFAVATLTAHAAMLRHRNAPGDRTRATRLSTEAAHLAHPAAKRREAPPGGLTARESDILALLAGGASNKQIARTLRLSVHTVERHVANLYQKIGARNRAEATAYHLRSRP